MRVRRIGGIESDETIPRIERFGDIHAGEVAVTEQPKSEPLPLREKIARKEQKKEITRALERARRKTGLTPEQRIAMREKLSKNLRIQREDDLK